KDVEVMVLDASAPATPPSPPTNTSSQLAALVRQGRIKAPDLGNKKVLYADEFNDWKSNWPLLLRSPALFEGYRDGDGSSAWPAPVASRPGKGRFFIRRTEPGWRTATPAPARDGRGGPWSGGDCACQAVCRVLGDPENFWGIELK